MNTTILDITNLHVSVGDKEIISGVDLTIKKGEVHVLFGPNGSGKSTLLCAILKLPGYIITEGSVRVHGTDTAELTTDAIANLGIGMSFQHPPQIKGVTLGRFLETINHGGDLSIPISELAMEAFLERELNVGFSGGELKRAEILKLYAQSPDLLLIDEPESGVDIENIAVISRAINAMLQKGSPMASRERSALIITHTGTILNTIHADIGHVFMDGKIVCSGNPLDIMEDIKRDGFSGCVKCIENRKEIS
ncbi:MAG: ABC transporter ATP-binding protein [Campylobacterales bacterium]|nr:ABC transporter ATP-binding protein [Campylobacterales bacterium]